MKRQMMIQGVLFRVPTLPNFILPVSPDRTHMPVSALTASEVEQVISEWASAFRDHVAVKRRSK